jgi:hypothetical protein
MADRLPGPLCSAPVVAIATWLIPGSGYFLIGQYARGLVIGLTIIGLFLGGLLIAGVRVIEVPGYTDHGERRDYVVVVQPATRQHPAQVTKGWVLQVAPLSELRDKPWSVPQVMAGPMAIAAAAASVWAAAPDPNNGSNLAKFEDGLQKPMSKHPQDQPPFYKGIGAMTHARINDIGSLYLSVAGLLNLMAIIDSAHRATRVPARYDSSEEDPA